MEAFDELYNLSEGARTADDPYGYGPYKTPDDPTLKVGDYIKAKQYAKDDKWYPGRVTEITPDFVSYTISGWGFIKNGTALRSNKAKRAFGNLRKRLGESRAARKAYSSLMDIQARLNNIPGWLNPDPVQDDEYTMTIKYDLAPDTYVYYELDNGEYEYVEEVEEVAERCRELGVSLDIVENSNTSRNYDIIVYLSYEGSGELNESTDSEKKAASKRFWNCATINKIDEVAFHTAFDDELEELGLLDLFDDEGRLNARRDYGRIVKAEEENPESWAIRALKKLWGMEYRPKLYTNHETWAYEIPGSRWEAAHKVKQAEYEKLEAERKAKEEEERAAKQRAWEAELAKANELLKACLSKVDPKLVADYEAAGGVKAEEDIVIEDKYQLKLLFKAPNRYYKLETKDISNEATITKYLNNGLPTMTEYINHNKAAAEFKKIDIFKNNKKSVDAILLTQSGQLYEVGPNWQGDFIVRVPGARSGELATVIDEPYEVIYTVTYWDDNNHSTRSDSHSSRNLSWNSKHVDKIKKFGNWVPDEDDYGIEYGYIGSSTETTKIENPKSTDYSHEPGIDSWAHIYQIDGATD